MTLARLLGEGRSDGALVATRDGGAHDRAELRARVAALAGALGPAAGAARPPPRFAVVCEDSFAFAVGLLGVWHAGAVAVSPPNAQAGALASLTPEVAGFVCDRPLPTLPRSLPQVDPLAPGGPAGPRAVAALGPLDREAFVLELFTSGTTGRGRRVRKRLRHLEDEVAWLERRFGPAVGGAEVFATASHQHLYALLFRVLWPLSAGRPLRAETFLHAEELAPRMAAAGERQGAVLASTPAHLRRLAESAELGLLARACRAVFSSGGPLDADTADRLAAALGAAPVEIFGSTETGGVAWRQQRPGRDRLAFTPFEGVRAERDGDGCLRVRSPYADGCDGPDGWRMDDRVTFLADGRFLLGGRADRTVKIGEKRLALPEMEAELSRHPGVRDAALVVLPGDHGAAGAPQPPARLGGVVVLSASGRAALERDGRRALGAALGEHLARHFDRALVPRAWRYLDAVPEDAQGKRTAALLESLFDERGAAATRPRVLDEVRGPDRIERALEVPAKLVWFDGHFPAFPVLPGVVWLAWVCDAARALLGSEPRIARVEALKFAGVVRPDERVRLAVEHAPGRLRFRAWRGDRELASGRLVLAEPTRGGAA